MIAHKNANTIACCMEKTPNGLLYSVHITLISNVTFRVQNLYTWCNTKMSPFHIVCKQKSSYKNKSFHLEAI